VENEIKTKQEERVQLNKRVIDLKKFSQAADSFNSQYEKLRRDYESYLKDVDLDFYKIINVAIDKASLETKIDSIIGSIAKIDKFRTYAFEL
jgi:hypothetical protein